MRFLKGNDVSHVSVSWRQISVTFHLCFIHITTVKMWNIEYLVLKTEYKSG